MLAVFDAMSLVFVVILEVLEVTLVSNADIALVFAVMLEVFDVILVLKAFSAFVALIISVSILFYNVIVSSKLKIVFARKG